MYIQMFILVRTTFILERIQTIQFHHKRVNIHTDTPPLPTVRMHLHFDGTPPTLKCKRNNWITHSIFSKDIQPFNFIKPNIT